VAEILKEQRLETTDSGKRGMAVVKARGSRMRREGVVYNEENSEEREGK
jgi:hypothetical protein